MKVGITIGCFDLFHRGHENLIDTIRDTNDRVICLVHDNKSIFENKNVHVHDALNVRMNNARKYGVDVVVPVFDKDPSGILRNILAVIGNEHEIEFIRGNDWTDFPGKNILDEYDIPITFIPYTEGVSSTKLRNLRS